MGRFNRCDLCTGLGVYRRVGGRGIFEWVGWERGTQWSWLVEGETG